MPRYDVQHVVYLTETQRDEIAQSITKLHTEAFKVPSLFVNVIFTDIHPLTTYIGGKRRQGNHILAHVRLGNRQTEDFKGLCANITAAWNEIVVQPHVSQADKSAAREWELSSLIMIPLNLVGLEAGFEVPLAGQEAEWLKSNYAEFKRRADEGEEKMIDTVNEIRDRRLL